MPCSGGRSQFDNRAMGIPRALTRRAEELVKVFVMQLWKSLGWPLSFKYAAWCDGDDIYIHHLGRDILYLVILLAVGVISMSEFQRLKICALRSFPVFSPRISLDLCFVAPQSRLYTSFWHISCHLPGRSDSLSVNCVQPDLGLSDKLMNRRGYHIHPLLSPP
jgi:hypothetical protein